MCASTASRRHGRHKAFRAFTLVELLVVVAIIALLISMLLPSLTKAKQAAVRTKCLANFRQASVYFAMYANDHGGVIPQGFSGGRPAQTVVYNGTTYGSGSYWEPSWTLWFASAQANRYRDLVVGKFGCPRNSVAAYPFAIYVNGGTPKQGEFQGKPFGKYNPAPADTFEFRCIRVTKVRNQSTFAYAADSGSRADTSVPYLPGEYPAPSVSFGTTSTSGGGPGGQRRSVWIAHGKLCNVLFIDGHASSMTAKQLQKEAGIFARWDHDRVQRTNTID